MISSSLLSSCSLLANSTSSSEKSNSNSNKLEKLINSFLSSFILSEKYYSNLINEHEGAPSQPGAERGVFFELYNQYGYLPITTDSHLGEYLQWAFSIADHKAITEFYKNYKKHCLSFYDDSFYEKFFNLKDLKSNEAAIKYILLGAFSSGLLLYGLVLIYGISGTTSFSGSFDMTTPAACRLLCLVTPSSCFAVSNSF